jgi:flagellar hook-associated protein 2
MSELSMSGLATGLDTSTIIEQLMSIERRPVTLMETNKKTQSTVLDRLRLLSTKMLALETAAKNVMGTGSTASSPFGAKSAASSNNAVFTASSTSSATPGTYSVEVMSLAKSQKLGGNTFTGVTAASQLQISNGTNTATISIAAGATVDQVASAINADSASGLAASVVGGKLVLLGKQTGAVENYTLTELSGSGNLRNELGLQATAADVAASDATIKVAGITLNSATNTFSSAVNGVTINAVSVSTTPETLTVNNDQSTTTNAVKELIQKYNDIIAQIKEDTKYDAASKKGGVLVGDPFASSVATFLNRMVTEQFAPAGQNGGITSYSDVGIQVQRDGTLTLDETKLQAKLNTNPNEVYALFAREDNAVDSGNASVKLNQGANGANMGDGIANRLRAFANSMTSLNSDYNWTDTNGVRYEGGLLNRINSAQKQISGIDDRIDAYERRLELREKSLRAQFVAMERAVSLLRNQGSYLAGQFSQSSA